MRCAAFRSNLRCALGIGCFSRHNRVQGFSGQGSATHGREGQRSTRGQTCHARVARGDETFTSNNTPSESQDLRDALEGALRSDHASRVSVRYSPRSSGGSSHSPGSSTGSSAWRTWRFAGRGSGQGARYIGVLDIVRARVATQARAHCFMKVVRSPSRSLAEDMKVNGSKRFHQHDQRATAAAVQRYYLQARGGRVRARKHRVGQDRLSGQHALHRAAVQEAARPVARA